ncbi:S8 family serine peptidase [Paenibacillus sp. MB22_1]|uniref:S8 family serine peptidase n=1 Tax=Paenibacillus TaxID=44249 RepID=UPI0039A08206
MLSIILCFFLLIIIKTSVEINASNGIPSQGLSIIKYIGLRDNSLYKFTGENVTVAIVDSGIAPHNDIEGHRIIKSIDFVNNKDNKMYDDYGHGTFVAGIIGANGALVGIAPEVNFIAIKTINEFGETDENKLSLALNWIYENREKYNIRLVYLSAGKYIPQDRGNSKIKFYVEILNTEGIIIVCPSGNEGPNKDSVLFPATIKNVLTVGTVNNNYTYDLEDDKLASFSSWSESRHKPELVTVGIDILSLSNISGDSYSLNSGTSFSAAVVTGVIALMLESDPNATVETIRNQLLTNRKNTIDYQPWSGELFFINK